MRNRDFFDDDEISSIPLINEHFAKQKTKCNKNKDGFYACINVKCTNQKPFTCKQRGKCQCSKEHEGCKFMQIKNLVEKIELKFFPASELSNRVFIQFENLIVHVDQVRDSIIKEIRNGEANHLFDMSEKNPLKQSTHHLSGKLLSQFVDIHKTKNEQRLEEIIKEIQYAIDAFKSEEFSSLTSKINQTLNIYKKTSWSKQLIGKSLTVQGPVVKFVKEISRRQSVLLQTPINQMIGQIIKWRIKIVNVQGWICVGIGLKNVLINNEFFINFRNYEKHGCYLVSYTGFSYSYLDKESNGRQMEEFTFDTGNIVRLQLNKKTWVLKFINETTNVSGQMQIKHQPQPKDDQYHICIALANINDEIQLLENIETDKLLYKII